MYSFISKLARLSAIVGGVVVTALIILTALSVLGRGLNTLGHSDLLVGLSPDLAEALIATGVAPINGDFELVEAGIAFAIFCFLPICQLFSGHATVDIFTNSLSERFNTYLRTFWEIVLAAVIILIAWRLFFGVTSAMRTGETTFLLQFPIWWAYALSFAASVVAAIVALYCAGARVAELVTGRAIMTRPMEIDH